MPDRFGLETYDAAGVVRFSNTQRTPLELGGLWLPSNPRAGSIVDANLALGSPWFTFFFDDPVYLLEYVPTSIDTVGVPPIVSMQNSTTIAWVFPGDGGPLSPPPASVYLRYGIA